MENYEYHDMRNLTETLVNKKVWIQGRLHRIRKKGKMAFLLIRYQEHMLQAVGRRQDIGDNVFNEMINVPLESVISLYGNLNKSPSDLVTPTYKKIELAIHNYKLESIANALPFQIDDANDFGDSFRSDVGQNLRLNTRWLDLRTPVYNAIFKMQSGITNAFRLFLLNNNFLEIHTPKLLGTASESGASVFEFKYFEKDAFLAQSPQLYKQMAINADFDRVFEIGPVFRAEKSFTSRHLCEYISLDLEMTISPDKNYHEILELMWNLLLYIFDNLQHNFSNQIELIRDKLPFDNLVYPIEPLIVDFSDGVKWLRERGLEQGDFDDLSTMNERELGKIVKEKFGSDLFILDKYPLNARPFYTMPYELNSPECNSELDNNNGSYSCSYDVILRGQEISSGAQRINDYNHLLEKIKQNNINIESMKEYLDSFSHGSKKHGGCAFGLERILMLYLNLDNIRKTSFCPRDPDRLIP